MRSNNEISSADVGLKTRVRRTTQLRTTQGEPGRKQTRAGPGDGAGFAGQRRAADRSGKQGQQGQTVGIGGATPNNAVVDDDMHPIADGGLARVQHAEGARRAAEHLADIVATATTLFVTTTATGFIHANDGKFAVCAGDYSLCINHDRNTRIFQAGNDAMRRQIDRLGFQK